MQKSFAWLAIAIPALLGAVALAADGMPDIGKVYQQYSDCHLAYDLLNVEVSAGQRPSGEELEWAGAYEERTLEPGAYCPEPPAGLLERATGHVISTQNGLDHASAYADKQDDPVATYEVGLAYFLGKFGEDARADGYALVGLAADMGDPNAQYAKAVWLSQGLITGERENAAALPLLEAAGEAGHLDAMFNAGLFYTNGLGTKKDPKKSFYWYRKAAERGHLYATIMAFDQISNGEGVKKDFDLAYRLARNVAEDGEPYGMVMALSSLLQGKDPLKHEEEILYWLDRAENSGNETIRQQISPFREPIEDLFKRTEPPARYSPAPRKACPMKTVCLVDRFTGAQSCTTNKDYWSDCDY